MTSDVRAAIDAVWRIEAPKLTAALTRVVRDVGLAEDFAQDALVAALEQWPASGIPEKPGAWLMTVAKSRAIDAFRRGDRLQHKYLELAEALERDENALRDEPSAIVENDVADDMLRLMFIACHPLLSTDGRVALTLKIIGGLTTEEIARAFLTSTATVAQRIVRAKRSLSEARVPFELPAAPEREARVASVCEVIYLIFNEGYSATAGDEWTRPELCEEGLRLGRMLAQLMPHEAEVHGLCALMELQASRLRARAGAGGHPVLLMDQDRSRWDRLLIARGLSALERAETLAVPLGPYALQAAISACHARARVYEETDWIQIVALYDALAEALPTPIVALNRAIAVSMAFGPQAGLDLVDELAAEPSLKAYHLLPATRGDLLAKVGRFQEARNEFARAAAVAQNARERELLLERERSMIDLVAR